ncbi:DUF6122 family protein [Flavobacteriaceae bacterium]|nr:DUF6122 family protein [Flavobacteriaceae bacterium]
MIASPLFDPNRCSIDFHPLSRLHRYWSISIFIGTFKNPYDWYRALNSYFCR